jgi:glycosyltransferase involved in cell wall biosynthesis
MNSSLESIKEPMPCHISIIVPTRNRPHLLALALDSIWRQSYQSYEVIIIDDASTRETLDQYPALLNKFDKRFKLHHLGGTGEAGLGPSVTRNHGISVAGGEVVTFCDDDDFWTEETHLATMAAMFAARPALDMYIANQKAVSSTGEVTRQEWLPGLTGIVKRRPETDGAGYLVSAEELSSCGGFAQLNILALRKETAVGIGGFWTRVAYEEDRDFFWRAVDRSREIFFNPRVIAQHNVPDSARKSNQSTSHSPVERWILSALVSQHIAINVTHPAIARLCVRYEGDIFRHISLHFSRNGKHDLGLQYAQRALAARCSAKWCGYMSLLVFKKFMRRIVS